MSMEMNDINVKAILKPSVCALRCNVSFLHTPDLLIIEI